MINFVFHKINNYSDDIYDLPVDQFKELISVIMKHRNKHSVRIYFDDGDISTRQAAVWVKNTLDCPVIAAITTSKIDQKGFLNKSDLQLLINNGVEIASHGYNHAALSITKKAIDRETPSGGKYLPVEDGYDQKLNKMEVRFQYAESKKIFNNLDIHVKEFIFPYGLYNIDVLNINAAYSYYQFLSTCDQELDNGQTLRPRWLISKDKTSIEIERILNIYQGR